MDGTLIIASISALLGVALLALAGGFQLRKSFAAGTRLMRFVPIDRSFQDAEGEIGVGSEVISLLRKIDPLFRGLESQLGSTRIFSPAVILALHVSRIAIAAGATVLLAVYRPDAVPPGPVHWLTCAIAFGGTFAVVGLVAKLHADNERRRLRNELYFGIDLIVVFLESGQSLVQALQSLTEIGKTATPLINPVHEKLLADFGKGRDHEKAFHAWADSLGLEPARDLVALFVQSLVHGVELAPQLRRFAADLAERRLLAAQENSGSKASRLTVVMVLFFLPAILLLLAGPPVTTLIRSMGALQ